MVTICHDELATAVAGLPATLDEQLASSTPQLESLLKLALRDPSGLLSSLCAVTGDAERALALLSTLIAKTQDTLPVLDLLRCYGCVRQGMPEIVKAGQVPGVTQKLEKVVGQIHGTYGCLSDLVQDSDKPALIFPESGVSVTHASLKRSIQDFRLPIRKTGTENPVVAIAVPNSPLLAATCVSVAAHFAAAPINPAVGAEQFRADVEQVKARCIITTPELAEKLSLTDRWVSERKIEIYYVDFSPSNTLVLTRPDGTQLPHEKMHFQPNKSSDICLLLFTSGTSGTKKIVPLTTHLVIFGAVLVIDSWGLSSSDICLNMMPLFHM